MNSFNIKNKFLFIFGLSSFFFIKLSFAQLTQEELQSIYDSISHHSSPIFDSLSLEQRESLYHSVRNHPVASLSHLHKYDHQKIGFCFGRAMTAHLLARKMGLNSQRIKKLFIIGDLRSGPDPEWRFHVTTLVKGKEDNQYYAIDPVVGSVSGQEKNFLLQDWIEIVRSKWDKMGKAKLYLTDPDTIFPDMRRVSTDTSFDTGEWINELSFNPLDKPGFLQISSSLSLVFSVDTIAQQKYFITTQEETLTDRFNFFSFDMEVLKKTETKVLHLDYRNYFVDLLLHFKNPSQSTELTILSKERQTFSKSDLHGFGAISAKTNTF